MTFSSPSTSSHHGHGQSMTEAIAAAIAEDFLTYAFLGTLLLLVLFSLYSLVVLSRYRRRSPSPAEPRPLLYQLWESLRNRPTRPTTTTTSETKWSLWWRRGSSPVLAQPRLSLLPLAMAVFALSCMLLLAGLQYLRTASSSRPGGLPTTTPPSPHRPVYTLPASVDVGRPVVPNIHDPSAVDAQTVCPGYRVSNVVGLNNETEHGWTADLDLAGPPCNVYGTEVEHLKLIVQVLDTDLVHVEIRPRYLGEGNRTWFELPEEIVPRPKRGREGRPEVDKDAELKVIVENDPTFALTIARAESGEELFTTRGSVLVYEDQFIEFVSQMPEKYNLYGLGETLREFRLGNNLTSES
jgi:hypothetical protein